MSPKTYQNTTALVDSIIHCAAELFRKYGYKKTTVDDISARLHISKKTLYSLFSSKEEILGEATWRDVTRIMRSFEETLPSAARPDIVLMSLCRYIFSDRIKQGVNGLFWGIYAKDDDIRKAYLNSLKRVIKDIYDEGGRTGLFKPVESVFATEVIVGILTIALDGFTKTTRPVVMFNDALSIIADSIAFRDRIRFDKMV